MKGECAAGNRLVGVCVLSSGRVEGKRVDFERVERRLDSPDCSDRDALLVERSEDVRRPG